jgi:hypothetical protein
VLGTERAFAYELALSRLSWMELSFYPPGTWLCRLVLEPQLLRVRGRKRRLGAATSYYFVFRPSDQSMPIMPLGNYTDWILRANKYYGLRFGRRRARDGELNPDIVAVEEPPVPRKIIEYLHFYYTFTRYDAHIGGPIRFRVPRTLADLRFAAASEEDRCQAVGALWRFLDGSKTGQVRPAIGTVVRFIDRCHADVPIQINSFLWRLRVSLRLRTGYVRLYGQVPFFHSPKLLPPPAAELKMMPTPRRLFYHEPWLLIPARMRAAIGALAYFVLATSWLIAVVVSGAFALTFLFHPLLVAQVQSFFAWLLPLGWGALRVCAAYSIVAFGVVAAFVFQLDGVLKRAARTAPGLLRGAYVALEKLQRYAWD